MTMDERVEAAARAIAAEQQVPEMWQAWLPEATAAIAAIIVRGSCWLAPWEASEAMEDAAWDTASASRDDLRPMQAFRAMRDAYLGKGGGG